MRRSAAPLAACAAGLLFARPVAAHDAGISRGEYRESRGVVHVLQTFASVELAAAYPEVDLDHDGILSSSELARGGETLGASLIDATGMEANDAPCLGHPESVRIDDTDAIQVSASFTCRGPIAHLTIDCGFLDRLGAGHMHLAIVNLGGHEVAAVATREREILDVDAPPPRQRRGVLALVAGIAMGIAGCVAWLVRRRSV